MTLPGKGFQAQTPWLNKHSEKHRVTFFHSPLLKCIVSAYSESAQSVGGWGIDSESLPSGS